MWWKTAKAGDQVVCINSEWAFPEGVKAPGIVPASGRVYTLENVAASNFVVCGVVFALVGCPEGWWAAEGFKPVQKRGTETGMAMLRSLLNGSPVREGAR